MNPAQPEGPSPLTTPNAEAVSTGGGRLSGVKKAVGGFFSGGTPTPEVTVPTQPNTTPAWLSGGIPKPEPGLQPAGNHNFDAPIVNATTTLASMPEQPTFPSAPAPTPEQTPAITPPPLPEDPFAPKPPTPDVPLPVTPSLPENPFVPKPDSNSVLPAAEAPQPTPAPEPVAVSPVWTTETTPTPPPSVEPTPATSAVDPIANPEPTTDAPPLSPAPDVLPTSTPTVEQTLDSSSEVTTAPANPPEESIPSHEDLYDPAFLRSLTGDKLAKLNRTVQDEIIRRLVGNIPTDSASSQPDENTTLPNTPTT